MIHNLNVIHKKIKSGDRIKYYHYAQQLKTLKASDPSVAAFIIEQYKGLLKSPQTKKDGLILILNLVKECGAQVFSQEAGAWLQACQEVLLKKEGNLQLREAAMAVVAAVCRRSRHHPELGRDLAPIVTRTLPVLLSRELPLKAVLSTLISIMEVFPGICHHHKADLEQYLLRILGHYNSNIDDDILKELGLAFSLMPQCSTNTASVANQLKTLVDQFLMTLQLTQRQLLDEDRGTDQLLIPIEALKLPEILSEANDATYRLTDRFCALTVCLSSIVRRAMVQCGVPIDGMVALANNLLLGDHGMLEVQYGMLELLEAVVEAVRGSMRPWLPDMFSDLLQVLGQAVQRCLCPELRIRIYSLLWALGPSVVPFCSSLLPHLLADSTEIQNVEAARPPPGPRKRLRTAELKQQQQQQGGGNPDTAVSDRQLVCCKALMVLDNLAINKTTPDKVKERMVEVLLQQAMKEPWKVYQDPNCRLQLYTVLDSLSYCCPDPDIYDALQTILQKGCSDSDLKISFLCQKAISRSNVTRISAPPSIRVPPPQDMQRYSAEVALADSDEEFAANEEEEEEDEEMPEDEDMDEMGEVQYLEREAAGDSMVNNSRVAPHKAEEKGTAYNKHYMNWAKVKNGSCKEEEEEEEAIQLDSSLEQVEGDLGSEEEGMEEEEEDLEEEIIAEEGISEEIGVDPSSDQLFPEEPSVKDEEVTALQEEEEEVTAIQEEEDEVTALQEKEGEWAVKNLQEAEAAANAAEEQLEEQLPKVEEEPCEVELQPPVQQSSPKPAPTTEEESYTPDSPPVEKQPLQEDGVSNGREEMPPSKKPRLMDLDDDDDDDDDDIPINTDPVSTPPNFDASAIIKRAKSITEEN